MSTPKRFPASLRSAATPQRELLMPQRHLRQATADAARLARPSGTGLDSGAVRERMVSRLRAEGRFDERVLAAMAAVPRHEFVDSALAAQAYEDTALPIGHGQTISKPSVVGHMLGLLFAGAGARQRGSLGRVLEIGTGCGYQAAVIALLARQVTSIERLQGLHDKAKANLQRIALPRSHPVPRLVWGDGRIGHSASGPFDSIVAAAGGEDIPRAWMDQLAPGGRLVAPTAAGGRGQVLVVLDHVVEAGVSRWVRSEHEAVLFVPLKSGVV
ncbi:protein-L-isoaspartate(D-aspartate) O-methyltransferase [Pelomonas aquatica]|jgi:protein-L-isoaspartate(D-aspartate) O-methyltransferase|uniref:Protein-L-isoaspartate O-methyltransferase n=1 Tax=Pelomonas aquatica TaxID=431058 RepID=A0A9X4LE66_9BURK|nr:protein-L-isoaspartate(D-aspartate) O-methyltransferase [Pelomonas aquatica]MCY4754826.1 protein-L-isoaspartate(D-aspartate) O-methyltransferase [Pelomonas aquatica]MDG0861860.1 protein-L-isoaspartate(D-aspartate) O-methyltransferase [Pelomonas aquatica]